VIIKVSLSNESIQDAIQKLRDYRDSIDRNLEHVVEVLTNEGAEIARSAYGTYPVTTTAETDGKNGKIVVTGDEPMIAEFGAGDATLSDGFENTPSEARPGSYSELHAQMYSRNGYWIFGGKQYTEVEARHGLLNAKQYIIENSTKVAQEAFRHD